MMVRDAITASQKTACFDDELSDAMLSCCHVTLFAQSQSMLGFLNSASQFQSMLVFLDSASCWKTIWSSHVLSQWLACFMLSAC